MKFGISIPTCREGKGATPGTIRPEDLIRLARAADKLGFDCAWANDHLTPSRGVRSRHNMMPNYYEVLTTLTYCAAVTERLKVATGVVVAPFRDPILLAKQIATLDVLGGGRVILGVGMGSDREEFEMLYPRLSKAHRGQTLDESLEVINLLFREQVASHKGTYYEFNDVVLQPKPLQKPLPVYISGSSPKTIERAVKFCSGLMVFSPTVAEMKQKVDNLETIAGEHSRDLSDFDTVVSTTLTIAKTREEAIRRFQESEGVWTFHMRKTLGVDSELDVALSQNLIGTPEDITERLSELESVGLRHCAIRGVAADSTDECIDQWEVFASEVIPKFKKNSN